MRYAHLWWSNSLLEFQKLWEQSKIAGLTNLTTTRYKILFLANWYPSRIHPENGLFIKKHAEVVAKSCDVAVLYVLFDPSLNIKTYDIEYLEENGIPTVRVYYNYRAENIKIPVVSRLFGVIRYLKAGYLGLKVIKEKFGRPDIIHVNVALRIGLFALLLNKAKHIPYIITEHSTYYTEYDNSFSDYSIFSRVITKLIFRNADAVNAVSSYLIDALKQHKLAKDDCFIVHNVIDFPRNLNLNKKDSAQIRVLTVSFLNDRHKNISGLIKAFSKVTNKCNNVELHIVGDGSDRGNLENLTNDLGLLNKKIFFHGYVPNNELHKYFAEANFFVLNSNYETFSVASFEALAHGVPVVITKCGGPEEFVTEDVGIWVERQNEESLVKGIEYMIESWHKYDPVRLHNYVKEKFSSEVVGEQIYEIYKSILRKIETKSF